MTGLLVGFSVVGTAAHDDPVHRHPGSAQSFCLLIDAQSTQTSFFVQMHPGTSHLRSFSILAHVLSSRCRSKREVGSRTGVDEDSAPSHDDDASSKAAALATADERIV